MTAPADLSNDPLHAFSVALPASARTHLRLDFTTIPTIRQAVEKAGARNLAATVAAGIGRYPTANRWPLMWHRIRRAAGQLNDEEEEANT